MPDFWASVVLELRWLRESYLCEDPWAPVVLWVHCPVQSVLSLTSCVCHGPGLATVLTVLEMSTLLSSDSVGCRPDTVMMGL